MNGPAFLPYGRQTIDEEDIAEVVAVLRGDHLTSGPTIPRFEKLLADTVGAAHAVAVNSGTAALHAACFAAGVGPGSRVIVPAVTFVATANCARYLGAEPLFADVDPDTGLILADAVESLCDPTVRAIIPVHLTGAPADLAPLRRAAERVGATLIADATHAIGARNSEGVIGSCTEGAEMSVFSFHPVKHVTTAEGGAVTTNRPDFERQLRLFREHGIVRAPERMQSPPPGPWYYEQQALGHNLRLSELHAALGCSQLGKLPAFVERRRQLAARYDALFEQLPGVAPVTRGEDRQRSSYHLYSVLIDFEGAGIRRADVMHRLKERGIGTQVHYIPVPQHPYYRDRGSRVEQFPGAQRYYARTLSLPLFPGMTRSDVERVVDALRTVLHELGAA